MLLDSGGLSEKAESEIKELELELSKPALEELIIGIDNIREFKLKLLTNRESN